MPQLSTILATYDLPEDGPGPAAPCRADAERALLIAEASYHGATWNTMAAACGVTKQSLHKRYADGVRRLIAICTDPHPEKPLRLIMELHPVTLKRLLHLNILVPALARRRESRRPGYRRDLTAMAIAKKRATEKRGRPKQSAVIPRPRSAPPDGGTPTRTDD
jgi:AcrR family transcriptional regulator